MEYSAPQAPAVSCGAHEVPARIPHKPSSAPPMLQPGVTQCTATTCFGERCRVTSAHDKRQNWSAFAAWRSFLQGAHAALAIHSPASNPNNWSFRKVQIGAVSASSLGTGAHTVPMHGFQDRVQFAVHLVTLHMHVQNDAFAKEDVVARG